MSGEFKMVPVEPDHDTLQRMWEAMFAEPYDGSQAPMMGAGYDAALAAAPAPADAVPLTFIYRNWRGEVAERRVIPLDVRFGSTEWHPEPQWLLRGIDIDKQAEREFALKDIGAPPPAGAEAVRRAVMDCLSRAMRPPMAMTREEIDDWLAPLEYFHELLKEDGLSSQPSAAEGWRPIASAPKDGSFILVAITGGKNGDTVADAYWHVDDANWWFAATAPDMYVHSPIAESMFGEISHWQPLPAPPARGGE